MSSNENTEEELQIVKEQDRVATLSAEVFKLPISGLQMPPAVSLDVGATIGDAVSVMQRNKFGSVLITRKGKLTGIITERDILNKVVGKMDDFRGRPVTEAMTPDPVRLRPDDMVAHVMNNMHVGGYRHVPIVDENDEPVAIVSIKDVMTFILDHFPADVMNTVGEPYRGPAEREGA
jgi:CBS domain-containing protein